MNAQRSFHAPRYLVLMIVASVGLASPAAVAAPPVVITTLPVVTVGPPKTTAGLPAIGTVKELPVVSVSLSVGSTEKESKRVVYAPPPGWYVRSHRVVISKRTGSVTYTIGTVPAGWNWMVDERAASSARANGSALLNLMHGVTAGGQAAGSQDGAMSDQQSNKSSHHVLVLDVTAKGNGLWLGGGGVDLTVYAEMEYLGK